MGRKVFRGDRNQVKRSHLTKFDRLSVGLLIKLSGLRFAGLVALRDVESYQHPECINIRKYLATIGLDSLIASLALAPTHEQRFGPSR